MSCSGSEPFSPLLWAARAYTREVSHGLSSSVLESCDRVIQRYLKGQIDYTCACLQFQSLIGNYKPVERICSILSVGSTPLPPPRVCRAQSCSARKFTEPWSPQEDRRLFAGIHLYGLDAWAMVATFVGNGRTKSQCCQRWTRGLDPRLSRAAWTQEEDNLLLELVAQFGEASWTRVASKLGNRCDVQCRYRYRQLTGANRREREQSGKKEIVTESPRPRLPPICELLATASEIQSQRFTPLILPIYVQAM
jgi:hypothetical protein